MIQANEIRIGNWVKVGDGDIEQVQGIELPSTNDGDLNYWIVTSTSWEIESINPIPLTPEILEKCGFDVWDSTEKYYSNDFIVLSEGKEVWTFGIENDWAENRNVGIKYLHQLQNLYFALTGNELEIQFDENKIPEDFPWNINPV